MIYAFLRERELLWELYDVVVFGYLRAVQNYIEKPSLRRYRFSTIVWKKMDAEVKNHVKKAARIPDSVSLQAPVRTDSAQCWEDVVADPWDRLRQSQILLTLHELATSPLQKRILSRRLLGQSMHEIAKAEHLTFQEINRLLKQPRKAAAELLSDWR